METDTETDNIDCECEDYPRNGFLGVSKDWQDPFA